MTAPIALEDLQTALTLARALVASLERQLEGPESRSRFDGFVPIKRITTPFSLETVWRHAIREGFGEMRGGQRYVNEAACTAFFVSRAR